MRAFAWSIVFVCLLGVLFTPRPANAVDAEAVKKTIDALTKAITNFEGDKDDLKQEITDLRNFLIEKRLGNETDLDVVVSDTILIADRISELSDPDKASSKLRDAVKRFKTAVTDVDKNWPVEAADAIKGSIDNFIDKDWDAKKDNPDVLKAFFDSFAKIKFALARKPVDAFRLYATEASGLLNTDGLKDAIVKDKTEKNPAWQLAFELYERLDIVNHDKKADAHYLGLLRQVTSLLNDSLSRRVIVATLAEIDASKDPNDERKMKRDAFVAAYNSLTPPDYKIHVISAWAGDVAPGRARGRQCPSTPTIQGLCQQKPLCKPPAKAPSPSALDFDSLCGFDPAPLADPRQKAVFIEYACVRDLKESWNFVAEHPDMNPETKERWADTDTRVAKLQSAAMEIRCPFPKQP